MYLFKINNFFEGKNYVRFMTDVIYYLRYKF